MFKTKLEVDRHVDNCLKKINSENARNLKGIAFAKLYFNVGDYEQARRYVSSFLNVKSKSAEGYKLLGDCLEKLGNMEAALEAYVNSFQIDSKQRNLVLKVCELLSSDDVNLDQSRGRYFYNLAQSIDPHNPVIYRLKERLITTQSDNPLEVSQLLLKELETRPTDVNLKVQLLKHFLQHNMIKEAYKHISDVEEKNLIFYESLTWYETCAEVLVRFQKDPSLTSQLTWEFWFLSVSVLDRLTALSLDEHGDSLKNSSEFITAVFNFDQMLSKAWQNMDNCADRQFTTVFFNHYQGQLYFHLATLIFKLAKKDFTFSFKEATNITLPVLFIAYHVAPPDLQSNWLLLSPEKTKKQVQYWFKEASYRCSQAGHIVSAAAKNKKSLILDKAAQHSTGIWREHLFKKIFVNRDQQLKMSTSFFVSSHQQLEPLFKLPNSSELLKYDEVAQLVYPDSLHHHIWIALNSKLPEINLKSFEGLQYSVKNLNSCAAESLNILDIQTFLYCATLCAKTRLEDKHLIHFNHDKPKVLPAAITENLATINQSKFFSAAYKMYKFEPSSNMGELRMLLIKGIEVVRCVGNHGLDIKLLTSLAETFEERSKRCQFQTEIEFNNARAEIFWKTAIPLLEKVKNNQAVYYPTNRLFEYKSKEVSPAEALVYIEKGKLFLATQLMKKKEYEKALNIFEQLKDPYASYYQSQIYKLMAEEKTDETGMVQPRNQHVLLSRARDCLYLTLDRLREPSIDQTHSLNNQLATEIEIVERMLLQIDPETANRNECDGTSDGNSSDNSVGDHYYSTYGYNGSYHNGQAPTTPKATSLNKHSTPLRLNVTRQEARPSPERLDAQIRQMMASRDTAITKVVEQNKLMVESQRNLLDEWKGFRDTVNNNLASMISEIRLVKTDVDELKTTLDGFHNLVDAVQEMKKEINDMKKDQNKSTTLNDEDLYVLEQDYGVDYNINSNIGAFTNNLPNMYPPYQPGRIPNANSLAGYGHPGLYPGLYTSLAYAYGGLGLPQPGTLPFVPDQQVAGMSSAVPVSYPQPTLPQVSLNQPLPANPTLGANLLPGQGFPQSLNHSPRTLSTTLNTFPVISSSVSTSLPMTSRAPPVNVVITSSDPLPTNKTTTQPILSVTIPPQHIKSNNIPKSVPHSYQISLPNSGVTTITTTPSILSKPPPVVATESVLFNVAPPVFSAVSQNKSLSKNISFGSLQLDKDDTIGSDKNSNLSSTSIEEHDPCPDFKPIIPLPDEVPVNTGEELETELFCCRAKLFRHVTNGKEKEWKERGVGNIKILHNTETGKVRILMRRDQVHKVCANHFITPDMTMKPMANNTRAYIWVAHDFADETVNIETFCVRFKTEEEATKFHATFESAKRLLDKTKSEIVKNEPAQKTDSAISKSQSTTTMGGFVFTSTPSFKPKEPAPTPSITESQETPKTGPFTSFQFLKTTPNTLFQTTPATEAPTFSPLVISQEKDTSKGEDSHTDEFVPTAEFKPVVALPELVEVVTGEENSEVLFEARSRLYRYDTSGETKEWKERGIGTIKILKDDTVRILMRRDQVHKVCCNHMVLKNMTFKLNVSNPKVVIWSAKDFSEGVLTDETFSARFKTEELANQFLQTLQTAQTSMDSNNKVVSNKHHKAEVRPRTTSVGEKHKTNKGNWECKNCYVINESKVSLCVACDTPKSGSSAKKTEESGPVFSFGNFGVKSENKSTTSLIFGQQTTNSNNWGNAFKPKEGSWECKACYVQNSPDKNQCVSCNTSKDGVTPVKGSPLLPINFNTSGQKFLFGTPPTKTEETKPGQKFSFGAAITKVGSANTASGFGDQFKPTPGTWECKVCLIRNDSGSLYCASCESPKDDTVPKKEASKGINLDTPGQKFLFGTPPTKTEETKVVQKFSFGAAATKVDGANSASGFGDKFKPTPGTWECKVCLIRNDSGSLYCASCESPKDDTVPKKEASKGINLDTPGQKFTFGMPQTSAISSTSSPLLSTEAKADNTRKPLSSIYNFKPNIVQTSPAQDQKFVFGSPQKHEFDFKARSPRRVSTGQGEDESEGSCVDEEEDNIYFKPVVPLPEKVEVKTGEEGEDVLYCHRAKLFRYVTGEWKERGIGDVKILRNRENGKLRVVMRREQVLKICLNHALTKNIDYIMKDEKSWLFHAPDFSEGDLVHEQFCLRFKNATIAEEFKKAVEDALQEKTTDKDESQVNTSVNDLEIVYETKVTPEEEKEATNLCLPPKFMSYRQLSDCTCDQCKKDDEYLKELFVNQLPSNTETITEISTSTEPVSTSTISSVFGTSTNNVFKFSYQNQGKSESLREMLLKPSKLGTLSETTQPTSIEEKVNVTKPFTFSFSQTTPNQSPTNLFSKSGSGLLSTTSASPAINVSRTTSATSIFSTGSSIFGSATSTTSIFGTPAFGSTTSSSTSLFDNSAFGGNSTDNSSTSTAIVNTTSSSTLFGSTTPVFGAASTTTSAIFTGGASVTTPSIFGVGAAMTASPKSSLGTAGVTPSIFGTGSAVTASSVPGSGVAVTTPSIFGSGAAITASSVPGSGAAATTPSIFGSGIAVTTSSVFGSTSVFGANSIFSSQNTKPVSMGNLFSFTSSPKVGEAGDKKEGNLKFGATAEEALTTTNLKEDDEVVLKCKTDLTFAALAATTSEEAPSAFTKTGDNSFSFLGAGAPVFGSKKGDKETPKKDKSKNGSGDEGGAERNAEEEYDPHYEPIIPLPEQITVTTGEEEETILFNERAKLYRFDDNAREWKERGVGQLKVLHHPQNNTYRLLLRREQVHKIVLNQLIVPGLEMKPMSTSEQAWMWAGYNYVDEENNLETLSVRFKDVKLAKKFHEAVVNCISKVAEVQSNKSVPATVQNYGVEDVSSDDQNTIEEGTDDYEDVEDEEEEDDEEDDRTMMFIKRCTLSELQPDETWKVLNCGIVQVYYDTELCAARIAVNDDVGNLLSSTVIGLDTVMELHEGTDCIWKAFDWAGPEIKCRTLKASFSTNFEAEEFYSTYIEGRDYAQAAAYTSEPYTKQDCDETENEN